MTRPEAALIDELEFRSYVHNRKQFPEVEPERWAAIFSNVPEMEERYLDMLSTGNILDVAESVRGDYLPYEGMSSPAVTRDCPNRGRDLSTNSSAAMSDVADRATGNAPVIR